MICYLCANRNRAFGDYDNTSQEGGHRPSAGCRTDVLLENYKLGGLASTGLDYATLSGLNPRLVHCSITDLGHHVAYAARAD